MKRYIKITRSDVGGSYIQPLDQLQTAIDGEFDDIDDMKHGDFVKLEVVVMTEEEYAKLPEFTGW